MAAAAAAATVSSSSSGGLVPDAPPGASAEDEAWMRDALAEAGEAYKRREVPVGCVVVRDGQALARGSNRTNELKNVRTAAL